LRTMHFWLQRDVATRFLFFQAEDGIRGKLVTGVQTCALPISPPTRAAVAAVMSVAMKPGATALAVMPNLPSSLARVLVKPCRPRSEERRVGKECSDRGTAGA